MPRRSKVEELKNLKASEAVDGSANLEILRYTQDDRASEIATSLTALAMTDYGVSLAMM